MTELVGEDVDELGFGGDHFCGELDGCVVTVIWNRFLRGDGEVDRVS